MNRNSKSSVLRFVLIGLLSLVLVAGLVLYYLYRTDTPFTAYVDQKLALHYEEKGDYEKAIRYYEKINTEESLSHIAAYYEGLKDYDNAIRYYELSGTDPNRDKLDSLYCEYGKILLNEKNYLKGLKMYESASQIPVLDAIRLRRDIPSEEIMNGLYSALKDPDYPEEDLPDYMPVIINSDNFGDYIYGKESYVPNLRDRTVTTWNLYLNNPYAESFNAECPLNYLDMKYCFEEGCYDVEDLKVVNEIWHWDLAYKYRDEPHPTLSIRRFLTSEDGLIYSHRIGFTGYAWDDDYWDPIYFGIPENVWVEEAEGMLFFKTELFR